MDVRVDLHRAARLCELEQVSAALGFLICDVRVPTSPCSSRRCIEVKGDSSEHRLQKLLTKALCEIQLPPLQGASSIARFPDSKM